MITKYASKYSLRVGVLFIAACATQKPTREIKEPSEAMRPVRTPAAVSDDLDRESLLKGIRDHIAHHQRHPANLRFGPRTVTSETYARALQGFLQVVERESSPTQWFEHLRANFDFYEVFGKEEWGRVYITSYFNPVIPGSRKPTKKLSQALYAQPDDLVLIRMNQFIERFPALQTIKSDLSEQQTGKGVLRGRLSKGKTPGAITEIFPYYNREEIDSQSALKNRGLELCYVDPVDAYFLQIQGSGIVQMDDGTTLKVGYAAQNGYPYVAVGKFMFDVIPLEEMDMHKIENYLKSLPADKMQNYLNRNPSYVFFQKLSTESQATMGTEVIAGRTIASDPRYFPKGTLALLDFKKPNFPNAEALAPDSWTDTQRLIFDQDNGGAIRGPARVDLFLGKGPVAKQAAGVMKQWGRLQYLVPKAQ